MSDNDQKFWEQQYEELKSSGGSQFLFPKADKTRVRLIGEGAPSRYAQPVESEYNGKISTKYLVMGFEITGKTDEAPELRAIVMTKTTWRAVCGLQAEGYDLFTEDAFATVITRSSSGGRTSYQVMPAPKKIPIPAELLAEYRELEWETYVKGFKEMQESRAKKDEPKTANTSDIAQDIIDSAKTPAATDGDDDSPW